MVFGNWGDSSQNSFESVTPEKVDVDYQAEDSCDAKFWGSSEPLNETSCILQNHALALTSGSSKPDSSELPSQYEGMEYCPGNALNLDSTMVQEDDGFKAFEPVDKTDCITEKGFLARNPVSFRYPIIDPSESLGQSDDSNFCATNTQKSESPNVEEDNQRQASGKMKKCVVVEEKFLNFKLVPIREKPVMTYGLDFEEVDEQWPEDVTKGWRVETRQRSNGIKDHFYYHPTTTQLRSLDEVKMHIKRHYNPQNMEQLDHKSNEGFQAYHLVKFPKKFPPNGKRKNSSSPAKPKQKDAKTSRTEHEETLEMNMSVPPTQTEERFNKRDFEDFAAEAFKNHLKGTYSGQIQGVQSWSHDSGNLSNEDMFRDMLKEVNEHFESPFDNNEASVSEVKLNEYMEMLDGLLSSTNK